VLSAGALSVPSGPRRTTEGPGYPKVGAFTVSAGFRAGAETQLGGYDQRNNAESAYQFDLGGDFHGLSVNAIYVYAKDAVTLSNYTSGAPTPEAADAWLNDQWLLHIRPPDDL